MKSRKAIREPSNAAFRHLHALVQRGATGLALLACAGLGLLSAGATSVDDGDDQVGDARAALEKWVETRRVISKERSDWKLGKQILEEQVELRRGEIENLRDLIEKTRDSVAEADKKRAELIAERDRLEQASASLVEVVGDLETRTKELLPRLPDPIRELVKPLSQQLPEDPSHTELSLGDRFQNVVGILNAVEKSGREISATSEVRALPNGTSAEVTALYVGIAQGYYVSADQGAAGIGSSSEEGWIWRPANEAAAEIAKAIAILNNEVGAEFVELPIRVQ
jgi:hypothetical protein